MRISALKEFQRRALPKRRRVLKVGKPGVGKTYVDREVCQELGWDYIGICSPLQSPVKIGGYPMAPKVSGGDAEHCLFDGIAKAFRATKPTLLSFDDLGMAGGETLKAIVDLIQFGQIDGRVLPDCVTVGGCTNDVGHGADVQGLIEPLKTRWHTIINVETHIDDVIPYGLAKGWPAGMLAFLRNSPDQLHSWKPSKSMSVDGACPRGYEYAAEWLNLGESDPEVIAGCIGKGAATALLAFLDMEKDLPDVDAILIDPDSQPVPENPSAKYLVSMALAAKMSAQNFGQCVRYLNKLTGMFRAFAIRDGLVAEKNRRAAGTLAKGYTPIAHSRDFTAWACSEDGKSVMAANA